MGSLLHRRHCSTFSPSLPNRLLTPGVSWKSPTPPWPEFPCAGYKVPTVSHSHLDEICERHCHSPAPPPCGWMPLTQPGSASAWGWWAGQPGVTKHSPAPAWAGISALGMGSRLLLKAKSLLSARSLPFYSAIGHAPTSTTSSSQEVLLRRGGSTLSPCTGGRGTFSWNRREGADHVL